MGGPRVQLVTSNKQLASLILMFAQPFHFAPFASAFFCPCTFALHFFCHCAFALHFSPPCSANFLPCIFPPLLCIFLPLHFCPCIFAPAFLLCIFFCLCILPMHFCSAFFMPLHFCRAFCWMKIAKNLEKIQSSLSNFQFSLVFLKVLDCCSAFLQFFFAIFHPPKCRAKMQGQKKMQSKKCQPPKCVKTKENFRKC